MKLEDFLAENNLVISCTRYRDGNDDIRTSFEIKNKQGWLASFKDKHLYFEASGIEQAKTILTFNMSNHSIFFDYDIEIKVPRLE